MAACPGCGTANPADARFCMGCAAPLGGAELPREERRVVSVLFADLAGFTARAEPLDPEDVRAFLVPYYEGLTTEVAAHGGRVDRFLGDGVMAVFGAPVAHEDDPERAVRAALRIVERVAGLGLELHVRLGVNTGEVLFAAGAGERDDAVTGDAVNTAARLQAVAPIDGVVGGEATYQATRHAVRYEPLAPIVAKGKSAPVALWRALGPLERTPATLPAEATPFVGREAELALLEDAFHATIRDRRPRLISVTGLSGTGKSRLVRELERHVGGFAQPVRWHRGRSLAYGEGVSFWALGEMVRSSAQLLESDDELTVRKRIGDATRRWISEDERPWVEAALFALLGLGDVPSDRTDELYAAWRTYFERMAADAMVVLVFEDLHWADPGLLDFIDRLFEWGRSAPLFVIALARPELLDRRPAWGAGIRDHVSISLGPLPDDDTRTLLAGLVSGLPASASEAIVAQCEGIPLYAVELVRMLVASGRLERRDGRLIIVGDLAELGVPATLQEVVGARLDTLGRADRALLADAAVLGRSFTVGALEAVSGRGHDELRGTLRSLVRREFLTRDLDAISPERGQYAFVQGLVREVAYRRLSRRDRRARHLTVARWISGLRNDEVAGALAGQYLAAHRNSTAGPEADEVALEAGAAMSRAADRAAALGAHIQALAFLEHALDFAAGDQERALLLERAGRSASLAADHATAERHLREALGLWRTMGDRHMTASATASLAAALIDATRTGCAVELLEAAAAELGDLRGEPAYVRLEVQLARALFLIDAPGRAIEVIDRTLPDAERLDLVETVADALVTRGSALCNLRRTYEGVGVLRTGIALAEANGSVGPAQRGHHNLANALWYSDLRGALDEARALLPAEERRGDRALYALTLMNAALLAVDTGDWEWARRAIDAALDMRLGDIERAEASIARLWFGALRGDDVALDASWLERFLPAVDATFHEFAAWVLQMSAAVGRGRLADVPSIAMGYARQHPEGVVYLFFAAACASWARDPATAAAVLETLDATGAHGKVVEADRVTIRAALAALDARPRDALAGFRTAIAAWRDLGAPWRLALTAVTMATLLDPADPEVAAMAEEGRAILVGLGARPFIERLDTCLAPVTTRRTADAIGLP